MSYKCICFYCKIQYLSFCPIYLMFITFFMPFIIVYSRHAQLYIILFRTLYFLGIIYFCIVSSVLFCILSHPSHSSFVLCISLNKFPLFLLFPALPICFVYCFLLCMPPLVVKVGCFYIVIVRWCTDMELFNSYKHKNNSLKLNIRCYSHDKKNSITRYKFTDL